MKLKIKINERCFKATLSQNKAVDALVTMLKQAPITISMSDYGGFEKVGALKIIYQPKINIQQLSLEILYCITAIKLSSFMDQTPGAIPV